MKDITKITGWFGLIGAILSVTGSIVGGTMWVAHRFQAQDERMAKIESAIKVLNSEQRSPAEHQLINELLAEHERNNSQPAAAPPPPNIPAVQAFEARRKYPVPSITISAADAPAAETPAAAPQPTKKENATPQSDASSPKEKP